MEKKIYVDGMFDPDSAAKVNAAVSSVAGVRSCSANPDKSQVLVDLDESVGGVEEAISAAISGAGVAVLN